MGRPARFVVRSPPPGSRLNAASGFSSGLVALWGGAQEAFSGYYGAFPPLTPVAGEYNGQPLVGWAPNGTSSYWQIPPSTAAASVAASENFTIACLCLPGAATNKAAISTQLSSTGTGITLGVGGTAGTWAMRCYATSSLFSSGIAGLNDGRWHLLFGLRSGSSHSFGADMTRAGALANGTAAYPASQALTFGKQGPYAGNSSVPLAMVAFWGNRFLTLAEQISLARNPWQLFEAPASRRAYSIPASGVSGSAAITEVSDTVSAVGALIVAGTAAANEAADVVAGVGAESVTGTAAIAESADVVSGTGAAGDVGTAAITEASDIVSGTGAQSVAGTAAISESADAVSATGAESVAGSAAISESADLVNATGSTGGGGVAAIVEPADAVAGNGSQSVAGTGAIAEAADVVTAAGTQGVTGSAAIAEAADTVVAIGTAGTGPILVADPAYIVRLKARAFTASLRPRPFTVRLVSRHFTVH